MAIILAYEQERREEYIRKVEAERIREAKEYEAAERRAAALLREYEWERKQQQQQQHHYNNNNNNMPRRQINGGFPFDDIGDTIWYDRFRHCDQCFRSMPFKSKGFDSNTGYWYCDSCWTQWNLQQDSSISFHVTTYN